MNEIRLNRLYLRNFQGGTFYLEANGRDAFIFGANATGKTRLVSAFSWLLFNKDALGRSDFEIKNLDTQGEATHGLEHTVEAEIDVNGKIDVLKKVFKEKWTKKRGNVQREFSGHSVDYYVNGAPRQENLYIKYIAGIIGGEESRFRLLTSPTTFPQLHWQKQRQLLLDICGDVSDEDVILSNPKLAPLMDLLGKMHTLEDHRKIVTARRSEINKEIEKIPVRIDEVHRGIPDVTGIDRGEAEKEAQRLEVALNDAKLRLQGVNTGGAIADLTKKLSGLNADLRKGEEAHRAGALTTLNRLNQRLSELETGTIAFRRRRIFAIGDDVKNRESIIKLAEGDLVVLREKWATIDSETFKDTTSDTCPACNRALPSDQVQEARDKALAAFNGIKAERLGETKRKGYELKERKERLSAEVQTLKQEKEGLVSEVSSFEAELKQTIQDRDAIKASSEDFSGIPNRAELLDEIEDIESQIKAEREGKAKDIEKIKGEVSLLQQKHAFFMDRITMFNLRVNGEKRIEELKIDEKKLAAEFEKLEGELYLIEAFIRTKVSMLTTRINEKFETVRFKLFDQQINGALAECCQITVGGVPFDSGLNNGSRINAGLEIVKVLQQHYKLKAPVFADNAEAVNDLFDVGCQMIRLYVSDDEALRVEVKQTQRGAGYIPHGKLAGEAAIEAG